MSDVWDVSVALIPPPGTGPVLLTGAVEVVALAVTELDLDFDHYVEDADSEGAEIVLVDVAAAGRSGTDLETMVTAEVRALIGSTPELEGWGHRVLATCGSDDEEPEDDLDVGASRLVPDGEQLAQGLLQATAYEGSVCDAAHRFTAWDVDHLSTESLDSLSLSQHEAALRRATALAGCLIHAAEVVVDHLFEDIAGLRTARQEAPFDVSTSRVLSGLPSRFADRYTPRFAQMFLVALVDATARFTGTWTPLACVAQELGLRVLLDQVEVVADEADLELDPGWREHLEDLLFEDTYHELLYDMSFDGIEDDPSVQPPGRAPKRFEYWFTPFNSGRHLPPYATTD